MRSCEACGRRFKPKSERHRFCHPSCRKRGSRGAAVVAFDKDDSDTLEAATRNALAEADRADSPAGVSALLMARKIDRGGDTGSAMAALAREHRAALDEALRDAEIPDDPVDELRDRRKKRLRDSG